MNKINTNFYTLSIFIIFHPTSHTWTFKIFVPTGSHYKVNDEAGLYEKIVSVKMLVIVIIVSERYSSTYW